MQDIHDIKPLMNLDFPWFSFVALLILFAGLLLLGLWAFLRWRKGRNKPAVAKAEPAPPRPNAREVALRALKGLKPDPAHPGQFYLQLEKILKEFLETLHQQPITGFTSAQLTDFLQHQNHASLDEARLDLLLQHGLQAKFASMPLTAEQMKQDLDRVATFVKKYTL